MVPDPELSPSPLDPEPSEDRGGYVDPREGQASLSVLELSQNGVPHAEVP
jgi:hypothetical protein